MTEAEQTVASALQAAIDAHGVDPRIQPDRAVAITADLLASPGSRTSESINHLRLILRTLADWDAVGPLPYATVADAADRADLAPPAPKLTAEVLEVCGAALASEPSQELGNGTAENAGRRRWIAASVVALTAVVATILWIGSGSDDDTVSPMSSEPADDPTPDEAPADGADEEAQPATTEPATTTETDPSPTTTGFLATFAPVRAGAFVVERGWRVTPDQTEFIGLVILRGPGGGAAAGNHRELPPTAIAQEENDVVWAGSPSPTAVFTTTAVFNGIALGAGEQVEIEYRIALDDTLEITNQTLIEWFEDWLPDAELVRSALGESDSILEPVISIEE